VKNTIKKKLGSRKLWTAVGAWVTSLLMSFNISENVIAQTAIIVSGIGALVVYILAQAAVDCKECAHEKKYYNDHSGG